MKVYETFTFNLNKIKFKDNKDFLDSLLSSLGLGYSEIAFAFIGSEEGAGKLLSRYPEFEKYKHYGLWVSENAPVVSSRFRRKDGTVALHIDKEHQSKLAEILKKIPRPINFPFISVMLDGIDWYGDSENEPIFSSAPGTEERAGRFFEDYHSNHIVFAKEFDWGTKYNFVYVTIDRRGDLDSLAPYPEKFESFLSALGAKVYHKELRCIFGTEEKRGYAEAREALRRQVDRNKFDSEFADFKLMDGKNYSDRIPRQIEELTPISGFSPKAVLTQAAKKQKYRYAGFEGGIYEFKKKNQYGHTVSLNFMIEPFSSRLSAELEYTGYNFTLGAAFFPTVIVHTADEMLRYAQKVSELSLISEDEYEEKLFEAFGKTPIWFEK